MSDTIFEWFGLRDGSDCGYCKSKSSKINHGMWAHSMSCKVYKELLDRGWRRSGSYCYKPVMNKTCCPQYAIRCDATQIKLSKSQKKVIKRFNNFLRYGKKESSKMNISSNANAQVSSENNENDLLKAENDVKTSFVELADHNQEKKTTESFVMDSELSVKGADPNKPKCRKAKEIRIENKLLKVNKKSNGGSTSAFKTDDFKKGNLEKSLEEFIEIAEENTLINFEIRLISIYNKIEFDPVFDTEYELFCKYQQAIHGDSADDLSPRRFRRFLIDGPLNKKAPLEESRELSVGFGPFHQLYYFDGKLVAVGVLDILPDCISSKYFFYDPDYSFLSLGTYSALREMYLVRSLNIECDSMRYYYMGYYIHNCTKMRYKGQYTPSYLLCPETYTWQDIKSCIPKLTLSKYARLEDDSTFPSSNDYNFSNTLLLHKRGIVSYQDYMSNISDSDQENQISEINEYVKLVGNVCDHALLYRS